MLVVGPLTSGPCSAAGLSITAKGLMLAAYPLGLVARGVCVCVCVCLSECLFFFRKAPSLHDFTLMLA